MKWKVASDTWKAWSNQGVQGEATSTVDGFDADIQKRLVDADFARPDAQTEQVNTPSPYAARREVTSGSSPVSEPEIAASASTGPPAKPKGESGDQREGGNPEASSAESPEGPAEAGNGGLSSFSVSLPLPGAVNITPKDVSSFSVSLPLGGPSADATGGDVLEASGVPEGSPPAMVASEDSSAVHDAGEADPKSPQSDRDGTRSPEGESDPARSSHRSKPPGPDPKPSSTPLDVVKATASGASREAAGVIGGSSMAAGDGGEGKRPGPSPKERIPLENTDDLEAQSSVPGASGEFETAASGEFETSASGQFDALDEDPDLAGPVPRPGPRVRVLVNTGSNDVDKRGDGTQSPSAPAVTAAPLGAGPLGPVEPETQVSQPRPSPPPSSAKKPFEVPKPDDVAAQAGRTVLGEASADGARSAEAAKESAAVGQPTKKDERVEALRSEQDEQILARAAEAMFAEDEEHDGADEPDETGGLFIPLLTRPQPPHAVQEPEDEIAPDEDSAAEAEDAEEMFEAHGVIELEDETSVELDTEDIELEGEQPLVPSPPRPLDGRPRKAWYDDVFAEHFAALVRPDPEISAQRDIDFVLECVPLGSGASVLDVGFGQGFHCFEMAKRGFAVSGVDNSMAQVFRTSEIAEAKGVRLNLLHGDMRDLPTDESFDLVMCIGTTFGYFDDEENLQALQQFRDRLKKGGRLVIQVFNRDHLVSRLPCRSWWQGLGCLVLDEAEMDYSTSRLHLHRTVAFEDGRQFDHHIYIRAFMLHDLTALLQRAGLEVVEVSGSRETRGRFYGATSGDLWIVAEAATV